MTKASGHRRRFENALEGGVEQPPVAGISFVPTEALVGGSMRDSEDPVELLDATVEELSLDFAFVLSYSPWAKEAAQRLRGSGHAALWVVGGPLWRAFGRRELTEALKTVAWKPEALEADLDRAVGEAQDAILEGASVGVDTVVVADDLSGTGPLVSPDYFNEHLVERYALLVATAAGVGLRSVFHSDGDIRVFLPGLARAGFIGVHGGGGLEQEPFERLLQATREQGMTLLGGLRTLPLKEGPDGAVRIGTRAGLLAASGGLIVSDDGGITTAEEIALLGKALGSAGIGG
jgi:hypothetical protein